MELSVFQQQDIDLVYRGKNRLEGALVLQGSTTQQNGIYEDQAGDEEEDEIKHLDQQMNLETTRFIKILEDEFRGLRENRIDPDEDPQKLQGGTPKEQTFLNNNDFSSFLKNDLNGPPARGNTSKVSKRFAQQPQSFSQGGPKAGTESKNTYLDFQDDQATFQDCPVVATAAAAGKLDDSQSSLSELDTSARPLVTISTNLKTLYDKLDLPLDTKSIRPLIYGQQEDPKKKNQEINRKTSFSTSINRKNNSPLQLEELENLEKSHSIMMNNPQNSFDDEVQSEDESMVYPVKQEMVRKRFSKLHNEYQKPQIIISQYPDVEFNIEKYNRVYAEDRKQNKSMESSSTSSNL